MKWVLNISLTYLKEFDSEIEHSTVSNLSFGTLLSLKTKYSYTVVYLLSSTYISGTL